MKIKISKKRIGTTYNKSLNKDLFKEEVLIEKNHIFGKYNMIRINYNKDNEEVEEIKLQYIGPVKPEIKYLYKINKLQIGLTYPFYCHAKLTFWQHCKIRFFNEILPWFKTGINIISFITLLISLYVIFKNETNTNNKNDIRYEYHINYMNNNTNFKIK